MDKCSCWQKEEAGVTISIAIMPDVFGVDRHLVVRGIVRGSTVVDVSLK